MTTGPAYGATDPDRRAPLIKNALTILAPMFALAPVIDDDTGADTATGVWAETLDTDGTEAALFVLNRGTATVRDNAHRAVLDAVYTVLRAHGVAANRTPDMILLSA